MWALQFLVNLAIAEILQPKGDLDRTAQALKDAESLLIFRSGTSKSRAKVCSRALRSRMRSGGYAGHPLHALIALEKAMLPAGTAQRECDDIP